MNEKEQKEQEAMNFFCSQRGQYIVSQSLWMARKYMTQLPKKYQEKSNIKDMKYLQDHLFPTYQMIRALDKESMKQFGAPFVCLKCEHAWKTKRKPKICPKCKTKQIRPLY